MSTETRQGQTRYWCHICNAEVHIYMAPDPTCQQCNEQFIEELHSDDDPREFLSGATTGDNHHTHTATVGEGGFHLSEGREAHIFSYSPSTGRLNNLNGGEMGDDIYQYFTPRNPSASTEENGTENGGGGRDPSPLGNFVQNLLTNMMGPSIDLNGGGVPNGTTTPGIEGGNNNNNNNESGTATRPVMYYGSMVDGNMSFQPMPGGMPTSTTGDGDNERGIPTNEEGGGGDRNNGHNGMRGNGIAGILQFISAMTGAHIDGLVGNPNDYAFSQTALDNIITQLMEQTGGASAPPPAPEQVIESLKKRPLTDKEKRSETDCAVCKDQFEPQEMVIELPCEHVFHNECIKPWLKLNGTCPVCRHSVLPEQESNNNNNNNDNNNTQQNDIQQSSSTTNDARNNNNNNGTQQQSNMPASWPLNLSAAFPWTSNLSPNADNPRHAAASTTPNNNTTSTSPSANNNYVGEDLELD